MDHEVIADNRVLDGLPQEERALLLPLCDLVRLRLGDAIDEAGEPVRYLYFPLDAAISVMQEHGDQHIEIAVIGNEGCSGSSIAQDGHRLPALSMAETEGGAVRAPAAAVRDRLPCAPYLRTALDRYHALMRRHADISVACSRSHAPAQRLARWLQTHRDRTGLESFPYTTACLAAKVGVPRQTAVDVLDHLHREGLITKGYNKITLMDPEALNQAVCDCFALAKRAMDDYLAGLADLAREAARVRAQRNGENGTTPGFTA